MNDFLCYCCCIWVFFFSFIWRCDRTRDVRVCQSIQFNCSSRFAKFQKKDVADFRQNLKVVKKDKFGLDDLKADPKKEVTHSPAIRQIYRIAIMFCRMRRIRLPLMRHQLRPLRRPRPTKNSAFTPPILLVFILLLYYRFSQPTVGTSFIDVPICIFTQSLN